MSAKHTPGRLQAGVSLFQGRECFTAVPTDNTQKIVALFGFCGADDEAESIANLRRFVACWNMLVGETTEDIEANPLPAMFDQMSVHLERAQKNIDAILEQRDELLDALKVAAKALETLTAAGRVPSLNDFEAIRVYAYLHSTLANKSIAEGCAA